MTIASRINALYQTESRRVQATLIRLLGDFDLAEESMQELKKQIGEVGGLVDRLRQRNNG